MLSNIREERGSDHLWPGTGHYNKQRVTIRVKLKRRQEVLICMQVGFILIYVTYDHVSLASGSDILCGEHTECKAE